MLAARRRVLVGSLVLLLVANGVPTAQYAPWQERFGFSDAVVTVIYAVAALGVLPALLLFGGLSDRVGRRPVVLAGLALAGAGSATFLAAGGVAALIAGRLLVGLGVGMASGAITAALGDLRPPGERQAGARLAGTTTVAGIAAGPLVGGLFVEYAPSPQRLVFGVLVAASLGAAVLAASLVPGRVAGTAPATVRRRPALPAGSGALVATIVASWALLGLFASLGPQIAAAALGTDAALAPLLVVVGFLAASAAAQLAARRMPAERALRIGLRALPAGACLLAVAALGGGPLVLLVAAAAGGTGQGLTHLATLALLSDRADPQRRAGAFSAGLLIAYAAGSAGPVAAGLMTDATSLALATGTYAAAVAVVATATAVATAQRPSRGVGALGRA
jgi:MFS family permease